MNINTLVVAGMETHISVCQTVLDALTRGYRVHVVLDATSSRRKVNWRVGLEKMRRAGAIVTTMELVLHEMIERVDVPQFEKFQELIGSIGR
jgi:nicotinamidase-related amidase